MTAIAFLWYKTLNWLFMIAWMEFLHLIFPYWLHVFYSRFIWSFDKLRQIKHLYGTKVCSQHKRPAGTVYFLLSRLRRKISPLFLAGAESECKMLGCQGLCLFFFPMSRLFASFTPSSFGSVKKIFFFLLQKSSQLTRQATVMAMMAIFCAFFWR